MLDDHFSMKAPLQQQENGLILTKICLILMKFSLQRQGNSLILNNVCVFRGGKGVNYNHNWSWWHPEFFPAFHAAPQVTLRIPGCNSGVFGTTDIVSVNRKLLPWLFGDIKKFANEIICAVYGDTCK